MFSVYTTSNFNSLVALIIQIMWILIITVTPFTRYQRCVIIKQRFITTITVIIKIIRELTSIFFEITQYSSKSIVADMLNWIDVRHFHFGGRSPVGILSNVHIYFILLLLQLTTNFLQVFGIAPLSTGPMTLSLRVMNSIYAIVWFLMYLVCFYYSYFSPIDPSANFPKICYIGMINQIYLTTYFFKSFFQDL